MKLRLKLFLGISLACNLADGQEAEPQSPPMLMAGSAGTWSLTWEGSPYRVYFVQCSLDLVPWSYGPLVEFGEGAKTQMLSVSGAGTLFFRLHYDEDFTILDLNDAWNADSDRDGLPNFFEIEQGLSPLSAETTIAKELVVVGATTNASSNFEVFTPLQP